MSDEEKTDLEDYEARPRKPWKGMYGMPEDGARAEGISVDTVSVTKTELERATQLLKEKQHEVFSLELQLAQVGMLAKQMDDLQTKFKELALDPEQRASLSNAFRPSAGDSHGGHETNAGNIRMPQTTGVSSSRLSVPATAAVATATATPSNKFQTKLPFFTAKAGNIDVFLKKMDNYFLLYPHLTDEQKIVMLLSSVDDAAFEIATHMAIPNEYASDYQYYRKKIKERFEPATSVQERRLQFRSIKQTELEDLDAFYERLLLAASKAFPEVEDMDELDLQIGEQMIYGLHDAYLKQRLLESPPKNSREILMTAKRLLAAKRYSNTTASVTSMIPALTTNDATSNKVVAATYDRGQQSNRSRGRGKSRQSTRTPDGKPICFRCGKANHIAAHCRNQSTPGSDRWQRGSSRRQGTQLRSPSSSPPPYTTRRSSSPSLSHTNREQSSTSRTDTRRFDDNSRAEGPDRRRDTNQRSNGQPNRSNYRQSGTSSTQMIGAVTDGKSTHIHSTYVRGYVNGTLNYILMDTGSSISVISKTFFDFINDNQSLMLTEYDGNVHGITNDTINVLGLAKVPLQLCSKDVKQQRINLIETFHVCEHVATDCLLGIDFMKKYNANINIVTSTLTLNDGFVTTQHELVEKEYNTNPVAVCVSGHHVIPARTQCFVPCNLNLEQCDPDEDWQQVQHVVFTPTDQMHDKYHLLVASCIATQKYAYMHVHVANPTDSDIELKSGTNCGYAEPCDDNYNVYHTYVTGNKVLAEGEIDTETEQTATERHVSFNDMTEVMGDNKAMTYSDDQLAETADWIKTSGLDVDLTEFTADEQIEILQLITEFKDIFAQHDRDLGLCNLPGCEHTIDIIPGASPVRLPPHRATPPMREIIEKETRDMLQQGIIRESTGEWTSPVVMARKKDGSWRFCVNYKRLNSITVGDRYPLPKIDDCFDSLAGSCIFSTLDLAAGYWQIPMKEEDKCKTGFVNHLGTFEFERLAFGLTNSPARFSRTMDILLKGLKWATCLVYLDDVIAFSRTFRQHVQRLREIFCRFRSAKLKLKARKCHLFKPRLEFLGHDISRDGISPSAAKVRAIKEFPRPINVKTLLSFLGVASFYRKYYKNNFAVLAKPLYKLTEKENRQTFNWRPEHEQAFQALKDAIADDITLKFPDFTRDFVVQTDAAQYGIGACLMQKQDNNSLRPISFASRTLNKREVLYSTIEKETLAILFACETFYPYLYGKHFILQSDHKPITYLKINQHKNPRLGRWLMKLQEFDFEISHLPGESNVIADALSRSPLPDTESQEVTYMISKDNIKSTITTLEAPITAAEIIDAQYEDPVMQKLMDKELCKQGCVNSTLRTLYRHINDIFEENGILYLAEPNDEQCKIILPPTLHQAVLFELHNQPTGGHGGIQKLYKQFRDRYYWPGMYEIVSKYVTKCQDCQIFKRSYVNMSPELQPIYSTQVNELVQVDCLGPMCTSANGSKYIMLFTIIFNTYSEHFTIYLLYCILRREYTPDSTTSFPCSFT